MGSFYYTIVVDQFQSDDIPWLGVDLGLGQIQDRTSGGIFVQEGVVLDGAECGFPRRHARRYHGQLDAGRLGWGFVSAGPDLFGGYGEEDGLAGVRYGEDVG